MKNNFLISIKLTVAMLIICSLLYPLLIAAIGKASKGGGKGETIEVNGKVVGYANVGQKFSDDKYFSPRPSAVDFNAAGSGGSNKGPSNPDYLKQVQDRIDTFLAHNAGIKKEEIPADLVTASGSGLDPDISPAAAYVQVKRIAKIRNIPETELNDLVRRQIDKTFLDLGPAKVNVLKLNIELDKLTNK